MGSKPWEGFFRMIGSFLFSHVGSSAADLIEEEAIDAFLRLSLARRL